MSGLWFALTSIAVALVIRWYITGETKLSGQPKSTAKRKVRFGP
jgi:hypothetical protein